ncbi:MAG TPA: hypothetical protein VGC89_02970 [Pyrinomonadaceae bacterium]
MAKNQTRRMKPSDLAEDLEVFTALKAIAGYAPANPAFTVAVIQAVYDGLMAAQEAETLAAAAYEAARDNLVAMQWEMHNKVLGAKDQVQAQFGPSSNEIQSMKRKKKTEYRPKGSQKKSGSEK